jgi:hypothetical protein
VRDLIQEAGRMPAPQTAIKEDKPHPWNQNWVPQMICALAENPALYLGKNILYKFLEQQGSESSGIYIYIYIYTHTYIYDSQQTIVILPTEHVGWCDWPVTQISGY